MPTALPNANLHLVSEAYGETDCFFSVENGFPFYTTAWMPSKEDMESLNAGLPLLVKICGVSHPPLMVYTKNIDGIENYEY